MRREPHPVSRHDSTELPNRATDRVDKRIDDTSNQAVRCFADADTQREPIVGRRRYRVFAASRILDPSSDIKRAITKPRGTLDSRISRNPRNHPTPPQRHADTPERVRPAPSSIDLSGRGPQGQGRGAAP